MGYVDGTTSLTFVQAGAADVFGSWVSMGTLAHVCEYMVVNIANNASSASYQVDVGVDDGSGNVTVVAGYLLLDGRKTTNSGSVSYPLPIHIKSGAPIYARCRSTVTGAFVSLGITFYSHGPFGMPGYRLIWPVNTVPATSVGTRVDAGTSVNTRARTVLNASTPYDFEAIMGSMAAGFDTNRATDDVFFTLDIGGSGSEYPVVPDFHMNTNGSLDIWQPCQTPWYPCRIAAGSRLSSNAQCTSTTAGNREFEIMVYGAVR